VARNKTATPDPATRPTVLPEEAFALLGISRTTGYELIKRDAFPVRVLRLGRTMRIPLAPLLDLLGQGDRNPPPSAAA